MEVTEFEISKKYFGHARICARLHDKIFFRDFEPEVFDKIDLEH